MYLLAILLPPLAVLLCGKPFQSVLALVLMLTVVGWPIGMIWACLVVSESKATKRHRELVSAVAN